MFTEVVFYGTFLYLLYIFICYIFFVVTTLNHKQNIQRKSYMSKLPTQFLFYVFEACYWKQNISVLFCLTMKFLETPAFTERLVSVLCIQESYQYFIFAWYSSIINYQVYVVVIILQELVIINLDLRHEKMYISIWLNADLCKK